MASFFADIISFTSWLNSKTESELKTMLTRADPRSRLNGSKSVLVRRVLDTTRSLGREAEVRVFPELRRRRTQDGQRSGRVSTGQSRGITEDQSIVGRRSSAGRIALRNLNEDGNSATLPRLVGATPSEVHTHPRGATGSRIVPRGGQVAVNPRPEAEVRAIPRGRAEVRPLQGQQLGRARTIVQASSPSANRPVPFFRPITRPSAEPVTDATFSTPLRQGFHNPRTIISESAGSSNLRTSEQDLQERLEVHAGLIIQSITNYLTPRNRRNSMSMTGAAAAGSSSQSRPASTSSAEKMGPSVSMVGEKENYKSMLECKICFDDAVNTVLLPCGHACCCKDCSVRLKFATWDSKCPICRAKIQNISMLYFS